MLYKQQAKNTPYECLVWRNITCHWVIVTLISYTNGKILLLSINPAPLSLVSRLIVDFIVEVEPQLL